MHRMTAPSPASSGALCTAFAGPRLLRAGPRHEVAATVREALCSSSTETVLVFDDRTGKLVDIDPRGDAADAPDGQAVATSGDAGAEPPLKRGRGRPKLGVEAREITLLPRHWEWLMHQPGGASATLRRLVDDARKHSGAADGQRARREAAYTFMNAMAGDLPGFEEAIRALFAGHEDALRRLSAVWPPDIAAYALRLAGCPST